MRSRAPVVAALLVLSALVGCPGLRERGAAVTGRDSGDIAQEGGLPPDGGGAVPGPPSLTVSADGQPLEGIGAWGSGHRPRRDANDLCEPVTENVQRAARAIVSADRSRESRAATARPWDHATPPKYLDLLERRYLLTAPEKALLRQNGFVVPARLSVRGYADALHEIYQSQLPTYVSTDAILHSVFKGNDVVLAETETLLAPRLEALLAKMHAALASPSARSAYPAEIARDADLYLTVGRSLLADEDVSPVLGPSGEARALLESTRKGSGGLATLTLFGRPRVVDFSQYAPRGHYAGDELLERYFRGSMWLSRLELNLVSRSSRSSQPGVTVNPEETPREAVLALALAELAERAGILEELDAMELAWTQFAGKREDVPFRALLALKKQAGITTLSVPDSADRLRAAIGGGFARTARVHYMPQGSTSLPAITTMLGPRIVPDAQLASEVVHSHVPDRAMPSFADVAFVLGHDRAKTYLAADLAAFPSLGPKLDAGRTRMEHVAPTDMYSAWLGAIRGLGEVSTGEVPSYVRTKAYADLRINSVVAAYGQLRHNYVLVAGQPYDMGGCEVPDGFVEPSLAVYEALATYAKRGAETMKALGGSPVNAAYFGKLEATMKVLAAITRDELAGLPLSAEEKRWLSMVVEIVPPSSDGPGSYDGWYFDLFPRSGEAFSEHAFVADWFTSSNANAVVYAGAKEPRLGLFVVDTGGEPRVMVGPVARAFEHVGSLDGRLKDKDAASIKSVREPWAASYTAPAPAAPPLQVLSMYEDDGRQSYAVRSDRALGPVTIEVLGHHRELIGAGTASVGPAWTRIVIQRRPGEQYAELARVRVGGFSRDLDASNFDVNQSLGGMPALDYDAAARVTERFRKRP